MSTIGVLQAPPVGNPTELISEQRRYSAAASLGGFSISLADERNFHVQEKQTTHQSRHNRHWPGQWRLLWEPLVSYDPVARYYVRLARQQEFEAWLLTWLPGQGTDWHDHGGSAGAFITLRGVLTERHAEVGYGPPRIIPGARQLIAGTLRAFGSRHVHEVTNRGIEPAVSLHVYSPSLVQMHQYEVQGDLLQVRNSELVGVNW